MKTTPRKVASLHLKSSIESTLLFQSLASKNKTPFVQSVFQQFLTGKKLSEKQKSIIDGIAIREGLGPIFALNSSMQGTPVLPVLTLNKNLGLDASLFRDAVKEMWDFVKIQDIGLNSFNIEKPIWVKQYADKREDVSLMNTDNNWENLKLMSFFSTDIDVLLDSDRNISLRKYVNRLIGVLIELLNLLSRRRQSTIEIEHLISSLNVAIDDFRYRNDSDSIFLKNVDPSQTDLDLYIIDLFKKYKEMADSLK